jgi:alkylation response protein AidB-like acyl-CoA dehydrogenase
MIFELTDTQQDLRDEVQTIAQGEIKPQAIELDRRVSGGHPR